MRAFTYDQKKTFSTSSFSGYKVVIPPAGSADMLHPQAQQIPIDGVQVHPFFTRDDYAAACCPGGDPAHPDGCVACDDIGCGSDDNPCEIMPQPTANNKLHDIAVAHLAEPVLGVTPSKVLLRVGSRATNIGRYDITVADLAGKTMVIAGTSNTSQNIDGRFRAYAKAKVASTIFPNGGAPFAILPGASCSDALENAITAGTALNMTDQISRTDTGGCWVKGDSGGPTFFNLTSLGGTAFPSGELLSSDVPAFIQRRTRMSTAWRVTPRRSRAATLPPGIIPIP